MVCVNRRRDYHGIRTVPDNLFEVSGGLHVGILRPYLLKLAFVEVTDGRQFRPFQFMTDPDMFWTPVTATYNGDINHSFAPFIFP
jgi:hypothetical protein